MKTRGTKVQLVFAAPIVRPPLGQLGERVSPPLGVLYLAAFLRDRVEGLELDVVDGARHGYAYALNRVRDFRPDILGLSFYTTAALGAFELISEIKSERPEVLAVGGGPHVTALPEELLRRCSADVAVVGEGEETLLELVTAFVDTKGCLSTSDYSRIHGIVYREDGGYRHTPARCLIQNLNSIPFPARDLVEMREYTGWYIHKRLPETKMIFSRGCPHNCTFCSNSVWKLSKPWVRIRSPKNVVDEIQELAQVHGIREIMDDSDEFNNVVPNALAICDEMKRRKLDIPWKTQLRAHPLPEELVRSMAEAGCWYVHLGIESGNPATLRGIRKRITLEQVENACKLLRKYGIEIFGLFMIYNVWEEAGQLRFEDTAQSQKTLDFASRLLNKGLLNHINWSITTPYPGSDLYDTAMRHDLIKEELRDNWDAWIRDDSFVMRLPGVSEGEQARMKTRGMLKKAWQLLVSGQVEPRNLPLYAGKALRLVRNEVNGRLGSGRR